MKVKPLENLDKPYVAIIDFEATCWDDEWRRSDQEVIEIGCVSISLDNNETIDEFASFIRPIRYPQLSQYCIGLTGIQQRDVDTAPTFPNVLGMFVDWLGDPSQYIFCSWGEFDQFILRLSCRFHRVPYPFDNYVDLKPIFAERFAGRNVHMNRALDMLGLIHKGDQHRAINDARSVARIWQELQKGPY